MGSDGQENHGSFLEIDLKDQPKLFSNRVRERTLPAAMKSVSKLCGVFNGQKILDRLIRSLLSKPVKTFVSTFESSREDLDPSQES